MQFDPNPPFYIRPDPIHVQPLPQVRLRNTLGDYSHEGLEQQLLDSYTELLLKVTDLINCPELYLGSSKMKRDDLPKEIAQRTEYFHQTGFLVSNWAEVLDANDFGLMVEKFYGNSPHGTQDDVWRISSNEWCVVFLSTVAARYGHWADDPLKGRVILTPPTGRLMGAPHLGKFIYSGTMFNVTGDKDAFIRDAMLWKIAR